MLLGTVVLLAVVVAVLAVPLDFVFSVQRRGSLRAGLSIRWMYGLVRFRLRRAGARRKPVRPARKKPRKPRARLLFVRRAGSALSTPGFLRRMLRYGQDLLRSARVRSLDLRIRFGMDDPADTGQLWALVGPLMALGTSPATAQVEIDPDFAAACLEVDAGGNVRIIPLQIAFVTAVFVLSPTTFRAAWKLIPGRRT